MSGGGDAPGGSTQNRRTVGAADISASSVARLGLAVAAQIATDRPDVDRDLIGDVVARTLALLVGAASLTHTHPRTGPSAGVTLTAARLRAARQAVDTPSATRDTTLFPPLDGQEPQRPSGC
jgi:hypothetical protein